MDTFGGIHSYSHQMKQRETSQLRTIMVNQGQGMSGMQDWCPNVWSSNKWS